MKWACEVGGGGSGRGRCSGRRGEGLFRAGMRARVEVGWADGAGCGLGEGEGRLNR